jgi:predicted YcjX-like family ATPase
MKKLLLKMTLAHQMLMVHIVRRMEVKAMEVKAMEVKAMEVEAMEVEEMEVEEMEVEAMEVKAIIGKDYKPNKQTRSMPGSFAEVHTCAVWTRFGT